MSWNLLIVGEEKKEESNKGSVVRTIFLRKRGRKWAGCLSGWEIGKLHRLTTGEVVLCASLSTQHWLGAPQMVNTETAGIDTWVLSTHISKKSGEGLNMQSNFYIKEDIQG